MSPGLEAAVAQLIAAITTVVILVGTAWARRLQRRDDDKRDDADT